MEAAQALAREPELLQVREVEPLNQHQVLSPNQVRRELVNGVATMIPVILDCNSLSAGRILMQDEGEQLLLPITPSTAYRVP